MKEVNEMPQDLMRICLDTYVWSTINGNVVVNIPTSLNKKEVDDVETLLTMIIKRMKENCHE